MPTRGVINTCNCSRFLVVDRTIADGIPRTRRGLADILRKYATGGYWNVATAGHHHAIDKAANTNKTIGNNPGNITLLVGQGLSRCRTYAGARFTGAQAITATHNIGKIESAPL